MDIFISIVPYITWIFTAVCWWRVFSKANIAGWKALIPFYCDYTRYKLAGKAGMYWGYLILTVIKQVYSIGSIIMLIGNVVEFLADGTFQPTGIEMKAVSWGLTILLLFFDIYVGRYIAEKFGKSDLFGIGLGLISIVFVPILAFGNAKYQIKEWI